MRTGDDLALELESPNWKLDRGKNYPVKMTLGPLSFDTEVAAEPNSVSMDVKDKKFEAGLAQRQRAECGRCRRHHPRAARQEHRRVRAARAMRGEEQQGGRNQPFCGSGTSAVKAGVSEGKGPNCTEAANSPHAIDPEAPSEPAQDSKAAEEGKPSQQSKTASEKPAKRVKSKSAGSRQLPSFLRRVDLLLQGRR